MTGFAIGGPAWAVLDPARDVVIGTEQMSYAVMLRLTDEDRAERGIAAITDDPIPEGSVTAGDRLEDRDGKPFRAWVLVDAPEPAVPESISDRQFAQVLALDGIITQDEALAWAARGDLPQRLTDALTKIPEDGGRRFGARMMLAAATTYERHHPLVPTLGGLLGMDGPALDEIWRTGAAL